MNHSQPRNEAQAAILLERYAVLEGQLAHVQGVRDTLIAQANAAADQSAEGVLAEMDVIRTKLEPWWAKAGPVLTQGKRKSIELGGCLIGSRKGKDKLGVDGDEGKIAEVLAKRPWAGALVITTPRLDKAAILKSMGGCHDKQLKALGFSKVDGEDNFFVNRAKQGGTLAGAEV